MKNKQTKNAYREQRNLKALKNSFAILKELEKRKVSGQRGVIAQKAKSEWAGTQYSSIQEGRRWERITENKTKQKSCGEMADEI